MNKTKKERQEKGGRLVYQIKTKGFKADTSLLLDVFHWDGSSLEPIAPFSALKVKEYINVFQMSYYDWKADTEKVCTQNQSPSGFYLVNHHIRLWDGCWENLNTLYNLIDGKYPGLSRQVGKLTIDKTQYFYQMCNHHLIMCSTFSPI